MGVQEVESGNNGTEAAGFVRKSEWKAYVRDKIFCTSEHLINIYERIK